MLCSRRAASRAVVDLAIAAVRLPTPFGAQGGHRPLCFKRHNRKSIGGPSCMELSRPTWPSMPKAAMVRMFVNASLAVWLACANVSSSCDRVVVSNRRMCQRVLVPASHVPPSHDRRCLSTAHLGGGQQRWTESLWYGPLKQAGQSSWGQCCTIPDRTIAPWRRTAS